MEPEVPATPPTLAPARSKLLPILLTSIVATALIVGGGVYAYSKHQETTTNQNLQAQIDTLKTELAATPTPVASASPTATASASPSPTATSTAITGCQTINLKLSLLDNGGGTAGTSYTNIVLTNAGKQACTVNGYPAVSLLDKNGTVLGSATNNTSVTPATLTVAVGGVVYAAAGFPDAGNFTTGQCSAASTNLSVTSPGATSPLLTAETLPYCPGFSVTALTATKQ